MVSHPSGSSIMYHEISTVTQIVYMMMLFSNGFESHRIVAHVVYAWLETLPACRHNRACFVDPRRTFSNDGFHKVGAAWFFYGSVDCGPAPDAREAQRVGTPIVQARAKA